ncbi:MAG: Na+/H+ antiporter NhaC family protein [Gammaproteobacteria bacterium]|nr:Na+/H+ antiporter NhaC family protein [Gammaproteobacteria bacterium]MDH3805654.1 Na+/H+ antiporter NhaC family protein [Gammaproteobacteria bacterium]
MAATAWPFAVHAIDVESPKVGLTSVPVEIVVSDVAAGSDVALSFAGSSYRDVAGDDGRATFDELMTDSVGTVEIVATADGASASSMLRVLPGWISLMPAFLAIAVALLLRNVVPALVLGLWLGSTALQGFTPLGALKGLMDVFAVFIVNALANPDHAAIIAFTMMIGGMVGIITRNGGMASIVRVVVSKAKTAIGGQVSVWLMGLMIFFDDYANTLVVGNTARSVTDHLKISREKLAYIVDSTAAPVVCLALVTTWIGYQVSLIDQAMQSIDGLAGITAYSMFLHSIPYSFYPILAIVFVLVVASTGRDMGPMYKAELRARRGMVEPRSGEALPALDGDTLDAKPDVPMRPVNAFLPIVVLIGTLCVSMFITGEGETITDIVGSADPYKAMMWASFIGALVAAGLSIGQKILSAHETVDAWYGGARATLFGMIVLVLAWSMSAVTGDLNAKGYLISILGDALPAALVPAVVFVLAAITAFSTGTSWGTMGILLPLVLPLTWAVLTVNGMADPSGMHIMYSSIACVLAGAVWGDHCSPISDTTVLSSIASGCNHIEHVRTQLPYAMLVGAVAIGIGTIPAGYGLPPWVSLIVGVAILITVLRFFGRKADDSVN